MSMAVSHELEQRAKDFRSNEVKLKDKNRMGRTSRGNDNGKDGKMREEEESEGKKFRFKCFS